MSEPLLDLEGPHRLDDVLQVARGAARLAPSDRVLSRVRDSHAVVRRYLDAGAPAYGVNRGLGPLKDRSIDESDVSDFQSFVIRTHDAGVGKTLTAEEARALIVVRVMLIANGGSGASPELFDALIGLLNHDVLPIVHEYGSVGSADLAAMAAIGTTLLGRGHALIPGTGHDWERIEASSALKRNGLSPVRLQPKDGLSLVGSNAGSLALASLLIDRYKRFLDGMVPVLALSIEFIRADMGAYHESIQTAHPYPGQGEVAAELRRALRGGALSDGETPVRSLQSPVSFRTIPQVCGALLTRVRGLEDSWRIEMGSAPDNPLVDAESGTIMSNGNFSTIELSLDVETVKNAVAHVSQLSEWRIAQMIRTLRLGRGFDDQMADTAGEGPSRFVPISTNTASSLLSDIKAETATISLSGAVVGDGVEDHNAQAWRTIRSAQRQLDLAGWLFSLEAVVARNGLLSHGEQRDKRTLGAAARRLFDAVDDVEQAAGPEASFADIVDGIRAALFGADRIWRGEWDIHNTRLQIG